MENQVRRSYHARRTPEQIKEILEKFEVSGKPIKEFVAEEGLKEATFGSWRRKQRASLAPKDTSFVELAEEGLAILGSAIARVRLADGLVVEVNASLTVAGLAQLIQLLRKP